MTDHALAAPTAVAPAPAAPSATPPTTPGTSLVATPSPPAPRRRRWAWVVLGVVLLAGIGGGAYWWLNRPPALPPGIAFSNGRLEADEVDISTKFAGRIAEILADEGTAVTAGQVVARMDTRDLAQQLGQAQAQVVQARQSQAQSAADLVQMASQLRLAGQQLDRARILTNEGFETRAVLDQRQSDLNVAQASFRSTQARIAAAEAGVLSATHNADLITVNIADNTLTAPKDGPIAYRLANVGEVLPAGGKVFTMLDAANVYMDIFVPTGTAGRARLGDEASIVLDAMPTRPILAHVSFLAAQNEFTPKAVETQSERDKLMFRVRVRIDPAVLAAHTADVRSGLPGLAYLRLDETPWPQALRPATEP